MGTKRKQLLVSIRYILLMVILQLDVQYRLFCEGVSSYQKHAIPTYGGKPPVKTIKHSNGDVLDCVDFYDQPAFEHPVLKDQFVKGKSTLKRENPAATAVRLVHHNQVQSNTKKICPDGTVPILRQAMERSSNATPGGSLKHVFSSLDSTTKTTQEKDSGLTDLVAVYWGEDHNIRGVNATISIWNPYAGDRESSLMYLAAGTPNNGGGVAVGWMVSQALFGDKRTRLFVSWSDEGQRGCDNLLCPGFVQTSTKIHVGTTIHPISVYGGKTYETAFSLHKDFKADWWVIVQGQVLGYFSASLIPDLRGEMGTRRVVFGGAVSVDTGAWPPHRTDMGSSAFPWEGVQKACYMRDLHVYGHDNAGYAYMSSLQPKVTDSRCYDVKDLGRVRFGPSYQVAFTVGGPGCPAPPANS